MPFSGMASLPLTPALSPEVRGRWSELALFSEGRGRIGPGLSSVERGGIGVALISVARGGRSVVLFASKLAPTEVEEAGTVSEGSIFASELAPTERVWMISSSS